MSRDEPGSGRRRPRPIEPPRVPPGALKDLKVALYELYSVVEQPTLDEIAARGGRPGRRAGPARDPEARHDRQDHRRQDRKSTRLNSSHVRISYAVFCLKKKKKTQYRTKNKKKKKKTEKQ